MAILSEVSRVKEHLRETVIYKLFNDTVTDETASTAVDVLDFDKLTMLVESATGVTGGVVTFEAARTADYTGTWASLGTATTNAGLATFLVTVDHGDAAGPPVPFVRARVSTVISGGGSPTVDVYLIKQR